MSFEFIKKLPTPAEIRKELPLPAELARIKEERDAEIRDVLTGKSNKFLVIIGPCSADNEDSVCDYVNRLAKVNEKVKDHRRRLQGYHQPARSREETGFPGRSDGHA